MNPTAIVVVLVLQLYYGHKRIKDTTAQMTQVIKENQSIQYGYTLNVMKIPINCKIESATWCNKIADVLQVRELKSKNDSCKKMIETQNKSIMDIVIRCAKKLNLDLKIIAPINYMRNFKKMILQCEIVEKKELVKMNKFAQLDAISYFKWKISFPKML